MSGNTHTAFSLLHGGVQRQLWRMQWSELRPLQVQAIQSVLGTPHHVLISAATASGKTEAAFLPVLSRIADEPEGSVRALYIGPLRALINDQFSRVEDLCQYLEMPIHRWHGDVLASQKAKLIKRPGGVLLLTPESLESLFVNRSEHLRPLFHGLRFVVIDELHAFLGTERGLHLQSLLQRLRAVNSQDNPYRIIALSATIGDDKIARSYVSPSHPDHVEMIRDESPKELRLRIHGYRDGLPEVTIKDLSVGQEVIVEDDSLLIERQVAKDIYRHCVGHTNLVFANSRSDVEVYADYCNELARQEQREGRFLVHHGSLARDIREDAEEILKGGRSATAFCSSTLELGVDIGSVRLVGQVGAPWSVSSLKQRVGRSGRRDDEPRLLRIYLICKEPEARADIFDRLHLNLVQTIAITQLMLSHWVEPTYPSSCDLSTLTQQIISVVAQTGGMGAMDLYNRLCSEGAFSQIEKPLFARLLRRLGSGEIDVIEQTPTGELILGLRGEYLRQRRDFYAVFSTPYEFAVRYESQLLGTLPTSAPPEVNDHLLFAGRRWQVISVDEEQREIRVIVAHGKKRPRFAGEVGLLDVRVCEMMRQILRGKDQFLYLDEEAGKLLQEARAAAARARICERTAIVVENKVALMGWCGTRTLYTLKAILEEYGVDTSIKDDVALICSTSLANLKNVVSRAATASYAESDLARRISQSGQRKYDYLLDDELLEVGIVRDRLDIESARRKLESWSEEMRDIDS